MNDRIQIKFNLDEMSVGDGCDTYDQDGEYILDSYWCGGCFPEVIAHVLRPWPLRDATGQPVEDVDGDWMRGDILPEKSYWYFGDSISIAASVEEGCEAFGITSINDIIVTITTDSGAVVRLPYKPNGGQPVTGAKTPGPNPTVQDIERDIFSDLGLLEPRDLE